MVRHGELKSNFSDAGAPGDFFTFNTAMGVLPAKLLQIGSPAEPLFGAANVREVEVGPAPDDLAAVVDVVLEHRLQRQRLRLAVDQGEHVQVERGLQRRVLEQVVQHLVRVRVALDLDVDPHPVAIGLVAQVADALELLVLDEVGDHLLDLGALELDLGRPDESMARLVEGRALARELGVRAEFVQNDWSNKLSYLDLQTNVECLCATI